MERVYAQRPGPGEPVRPEHQRTVTGAGMSARPVKGVHELLGIQVKVSVRESKDKSERFCDNLHPQPL